MKIHQMPLGARFEYEAEEYVKTGPMIGTGKAGQRFIPKYAVLKPIGEVGGAQEKTKNGSVSKAKFRKAFETFYTECKRQVPEERRMALDAARDQFLKDLG